MNYERCNQCGAQVRWATNAETSRRSPLDVQPWEQHGNALLHEDGKYFQVLPAEMVSRARDREFPLYTIHFATCPGREAPTPTKLSFDEGDVL